MHNRLLITPFLAFVLSATGLHFTIHGNQLHIKTSGAGFHVSVVERGNIDFLNWLEIESPTSGERCRLFESREYVLLGNRIIGIEWTGSTLLFNLCEPAQEAIVRLPGPVADFPPSSVLGLRWSVIYDINPGNPAPYVVDVKEVEVLENVLKIRIAIPNEGQGEIHVSHDLKLKAAFQGDERVPLFETDLRKLRLRHSVFRRSVLVGGKQLIVWLRPESLFEDLPNEGTYFVVKTVLNGQELTWIGPKPERWLLLNGDLVGIGIYEDSHLVVNKARPSDQVRTYTIDGKMRGEKAADALRNLFGGHVVSIAGRPVVRDARVVNERIETIVSTNDGTFLVEVDLEAASRSEAIRIKQVPR